MKISAGAGRGRGLAEGEPDEAIKTVADAVGMKRDELAAIWQDYVYQVRLDDQLLDILKLHAGWRLESGNHPPGATMPDFAKVLALGPLRAIDRPASQRPAK